MKVQFLSPSSVSAMSSSSSSSENRLNFRALEPTVQENKKMRRSLLAPMSDGRFTSLCGYSSSKLPTPGPIDPMANQNPARPQTNSDVYYGGMMKASLMVGKKRGFTSALGKPAGISMMAKGSPSAVGLSGNAAVAANLFSGHSSSNTNALSAADKLSLIHGNKQQRAGRDFDRQTPLAGITYQINSTPASPAFNMSEPRPSAKTGINPQIAKAMTAGAGKNIALQKSPPPAPPRRHSTGGEIATPPRPPPRPSIGGGEFKLPPMPDLFKKPGVAPTNLPAPSPSAVNALPPSNPRGGIGTPSSTLGDPPQGAAMAGTSLSLDGSENPETTAAGRAVVKMENTTRGAQALEGAIESKDDPTSSAGRQVYAAEELAKSRAMVATENVSSSAVPKTSGSTDDASVPVTPVKGAKTEVALETTPFGKELDAWIDDNLKETEYDEFTPMIALADPELVFSSKALSAPSGARLTADPADVRGNPASTTQPSFGRPSMSVKNTTTTSGGGVALIKSAQLQKKAAVESATRGSTTGPAAPAKTRPVTTAAGRSDSSASVATQALVDASEMHM